METFTIYGVPQKWMVKGRESWIEAGQNGLIAHDIVEHQPEHYGLITDELEAYGAMFYTRNEDDHYEFKFSDMLGFIGNLWQTYKDCELLSSGYTIPRNIQKSLNKSLHNDQRDWRHYLSWRKVDPDMYKKIQDWAFSNSTEIASWIAAGYWKTKKRYEDMNIPRTDPQSMWLFDTHGNKDGSIHQKMWYLIDCIKTPGVYKITMGVSGFNAEAVFLEHREESTLLLPPMFLPIDRKKWYKRPDGKTKTKLTRRQRKRLKMQQQAAA
jgi:hypothetical protein